MACVVCEFRAVAGCSRVYTSYYIYGHGARRNEVRTREVFAFSKYKKTLKPYRLQ